MRKVNWIHDLIQDLGYAARQLRRNPGFTVVAVVTLALGIGGTTAILSVTKAVLLQALPFPDLDRLVMVWGQNSELGWNYMPFSPAEFAAYRDRSKSFEQIAGVEAISFNLVAGVDPEVVAGGRATAGLFSLLRVSPLLGRTFTPEEGQPGRGNVVLLTHDLWQRRFGADPGVLGRVLKLYHTPALIPGAEAQPVSDIFTVIGVLPPGFLLPTVQAEVWVPRASEEQTTTRGGSLQMVARLRPGVTPAGAQAELDILTRRMKQQFPETAKDRAHFLTLQEHDIGDVRPTLLILLASVGLVLLIACANVANLLLARLTVRQRDMAMRLVLGAGRGRLLRQLLTESLLLAVVGGAAGWLLAFWITPGLVALTPGDALRHRQVTMDLSVFGAALGVTLLTGLLFGLAPAFTAARTELAEALQEGSRGATGGTGRHRMRSALVVAEVAMSLVVLVGAGLLAQTLLHLMRVEPGFNPHNLLTARVALPPAKYSAPQQRTTFFRQVLERARALPGVQAAGATTVLPTAGSPAAIFFTAEGQPPPAPDAIPTVNVSLVSPDYFRAMGIPIVRGSEFTEENLGRIRVIVSESLARRYWPDEDPIGKGIKLNRPENPGPFIPILGVVKDVRQSGPQDEARPALYLPMLHQPAMTLVVRTARDPLELAAALRREVLALDPEQPVHDVRTMEQRLDEVVAQERFRALLLGFFAGAALLLAALGIHGVIAYAVSQRTHEIGIRMALGAQARDVLRMVVGHGLRLALTGLLIGAAAALALTRWMSTVLFGVSAVDPVSYFAAGAMLCAVAVAACWLPAHRATRVDPMAALRHE